MKFEKKFKIAKEHRLVLRRRAAWSAEIISGTFGEMTYLMTVKNVELID
jgi:hypothetical protein